MQLDLWISWSCFFFFIFTAKHHHSGKMPTSSHCRMRVLHHKWQHPQPWHPSVLCRISAQMKVDLRRSGFCWVFLNDERNENWQHPGDSKCPFDSLVGGHLTIEKGHLTIPKRGQRTARTLWFICFYDIFTYMTWRMIRGYTTQLYMVFL